MAHTLPTGDILVNLTTHHSFSDGSPNSVIIATNFKGIGRAWDGHFVDRTHLHFPALTINVWSPPDRTRSGHVVDEAGLGNNGTGFWLLLIIVCILVLRELLRIIDTTDTDATKHAAMESGRPAERPSAQTVTTSEPAMTARNADRAMNIAFELQGITNPYTLSPYQLRVLEAVLAVQLDSVGPEADPNQSFEESRKEGLPLAEAQGPQPLQHTKTVATSSGRAATPPHAALKEQTQPVELGDAASVSSDGTSRSRASSQCTLGLEAMRAILRLATADMEPLQQSYQALDADETYSSSEAEDEAPNPPTRLNMEDNSTISPIVQLPRETAGFGHHVVRTGWK